MVICEYYAEIVQRILKHNMDFGKYPRMRVLVQDYFVALNQHNDGNHLIQTFIYRYNLIWIFFRIIVMKTSFLFFFLLVFMDEL